MTLNRRSWYFAIAGFGIAWLLGSMWWLLNRFVQPSLNAGLVIEAATVALCPFIISMMASGDRLFPQLINMLAVSCLNAAWYYALGRIILWVHGYHKASSL
jgi:hypothetical protein